jgi:hypothetical protein
MKPDAGGATAGYDPSAIASDPTAMMHMLGPIMFVYFAVWFAICAFFAFLNWRVFSKAGYPGALGLIWLALAIPVLNILACLAILIVWTWFAFAQWPVLKGQQTGGPVKA